jgi:hypothetical protein
VYTNLNLEGEGKLTASSESPFGVLAPEEISPKIDM